LQLSPSGEKSLVMRQTAQRVALPTLIVIAIVAVALALLKLKLVIALIFLAFILAAALRPSIERLRAWGFRAGSVSASTASRSRRWSVSGLWIVVPRAIGQVQNALGGSPQARIHQEATRSYRV
jgi:predicted PurR-regulated permease PerM